MTKYNVSVVIPIYNRAHCIERLISCINKQTYKVYEIIVVDDCSNDNIQMVMNKYPEVVFIKMKTNRGGGVARNKGIEKAKGDLIAFLDSDDLWHSIKIEKQIKLWSELDKKENTIIFSKSRYMPEKIVIPKKEFNYSISAFENMFFNMGVLQTSGILIPTFLANKVKFSEIRVHQDYDFIIKCQKENAEFACVNEVLYDFISDQFDTRITSNFNAANSLNWIIRNKEFFNKKMISHYIKKYDIFDRLFFQEKINKSIVLVIRFYISFYKKFSILSIKEILVFLRNHFKKRKLKYSLTRNSNVIYVIYGARNGLSKALYYIKYLNININFVIDNNINQNNNKILNSKVSTIDDFVKENKEYSKKVVFLLTALNKNTYASMHNDIYAKLKNINYKFEIYNLHHLN